MVSKTTEPNTAKYNSGHPTRTRTTTPFITLQGTGHHNRHQTPKSKNAYEGAEERAQTTATQSLLPLATPRLHRPPPFAHITRVYLYRNFFTYIGYCTSNFRQIQSPTKKLSAYSPKVHFRSTSHHRSRPQSHGLSQAPPTTKIAWIAPNTPHTKALQLPLHP